jgi:hypothetical protein
MEAQYTRLSKSQTNVRLKLNLDDNLPQNKIFTMKIRPFTATQSIQRIWSTVISISRRN